jgi:hypothetical protein
MAITVETTPTDPTPAYNEQRLVLSSTNSGQAGFEYIVTLRAGNEAATSLGNPITLRKSPDPNGYGVFDLSKLTADYVDTDFTGNIDEFEVNSKTNKVFFFETLAEWTGGNEIGATGIYNAFNGVLSVEDWVGATNDNWSFDIAYPAAQGMMSNYRGIQKSKIDECGFLYFQSRRSTQITGADLVTNGAFASNLTGWTLNPAAAWTWNSGTARSASASTSGTIYSIFQTFTVTSGKYYQVTFDLNMGKGSIELTTGDYNADAITSYSSSVGVNYGTIKVIWKALSNSQGIGFHFVPSINNEFAVIDNVKFEEIEILPFSAEIKTYNSSNTLINTFVLKNTSPSEFQYNWLRYNTNTDAGFVSWRIPSGAKNLNLIDNADLSTGTQPIITSAVSYWVIKIKTSAGNLFGEFKCYLNSQCSKYKSFRLHWLNRLGGYDSFTFDMASQEDINIERNFFTKLLQNSGNYSSPKSYGYTTRGETQYHTQYSTIYSVTSNWITESESNMLAEMMTSPNVYWEKDADNNKFIPINIKATTYRKQSKTNNNTKVFNHEFQFEVSYKEKIQGR